MCYSHLKKYILHRMNVKLKKCAMIQFKLLSDEQIM